MKKHSLRLRLSSLWLAVLVLTSSVGLTVQQHTCHLSGHTQRAIVLTPHHGCAGPVAAERGCGKSTASVSEKAPGAALADGCCAFSAEHHKVEAKAGFSVLPTAMPALLAVLPAPLWPGLATSPVAAAAPQLRLHATDASPPPRAGRALLAFVCVLVV